jgi:hypothetical protein
MPPVLQQRKTLERLLRSSLPDNRMIVVGPDHPFLLRSADLLVEGSDSIGAIFVPTALERKKTPLLRSRLILNRLALPTNTICFLVVEPGDDELRDIFANDFSDIVEMRQTDRLSAILAADPRQAPRGEVPLEVQALAYRSFVQVFDTTEEIAARARGTADAEQENPWELTAELFAVKPRKSRKTAHRIASEDLPDQAENVPMQTFSQGEVQSSTLVPLFAEQIDRLYSLDMGIPYPKDEGTGVILVDSFPVQRLDPKKVVRAAAFAGWSMMLQADRDYLPEMINRIRKIRRVAS